MTRLAEKGDNNRHKMCSSKYGLSWIIVLLSCRHEDLLYPKRVVYLTNSSFEENDTV